MKIEIKSLTKSFDSETVIDNLSVTLNGPGLYIIKGDSGVGKTTLLRIIAGIDRIYTGFVTHFKAGQISFAFQEYRLFETLNAIENVTLGARDAASFLSARSILSRLNFANKDMYLFPNELSGGMKQRVSLARAFLHKGEVLLLDEPTKELDKGNVSNVIEMIRKEAATRLVIMVTHKSEDIETLSDMAKIIELTKNT